MVSRCVIRAVTPPTTEISSRNRQSRFPDVTEPARFDCRFDLLLRILKAPYHEDPLVDRRSSTFRPSVGAVCAAGVGETDGSIFMPCVEGATPLLQSRRQTGGREFGPVSGFRTGTSHPGAPAAPDSREEDPRPGEHDSNAPMLCADTLSRPGCIVRTANYGRPQPVPRPPLAVLPLSPTLTL
jgi:hypothetical protein